MAGQYGIFVGSEGPKIFRVKKKIFLFQNYIHPIVHLSAPIEAIITNILVEHNTREGVCVIINSFQWTDFLSALLRFFYFALQRQIWLVNKFNEAYVYIKLFWQPNSWLPGQYHSCQLGGGILSSKIQIYVTFDSIFSKICHEIWCAQSLCIELSSTKHSIVHISAE